MSSRGSILVFTALVGTLLVIRPGAGEELRTSEEIRACAQRNLPDLGNVQAIELRAADRTGSVNVTRAHIYARRDADQHRRVLVRFTQPEALVGSAFMIVERDGHAELTVRSADFPKTKRIAGRELLGSVAGTDFSYEDFTRLAQLNSPGSPERLADAVVEGRDAYLLESYPRDPEHSAYSRVRTYVDKETCVLTRMEFFEPGDKLRKELVAHPERVRKLESVGVAHEVIMRDLRDGTETRLLVESFDMDADLPASVFTLDAPGNGAPPGD